MHRYFRACYYLPILIYVYWRVAVALRIIAGILLGIWFVLVLTGRGGFVHLLLLCGLGVAMVEAVTVYRSRMTV